MIRERGRPPVAACNIARAYRAAPEPLHDLRANAFHRFAVEARLRKRKPEIIERLLAVLLERAQGAAQRIAPGTEAELDGFALEAVMEGHCIKRTCAFIQQVGREIGDTRLVHRILLSSRSANSSAISGTVGLRTSQASMPAGLTTRSIVTARAGGANASTAAASSAASTQRLPRRKKTAGFTNVSPGAENP